MKADVCPNPLSLNPGSAPVVLSVHNAVCRRLPLIVPPVSFLRICLVPRPRSLTARLISVTSRKPVVLRFLSNKRPENKEAVEEQGKKRMSSECGIMQDIQVCGAPKVPVKVRGSLQ